MNKIIKYFSLLLVFTLFVGINSAEAQKRKTKRQLKEEAAKEAAKKEKAQKKNSDDEYSTDDYFDDKGGFKHKLWYGGMFNFSIASSQFGGSQMLIGLSPMVGYKITDFLSVGPRVSMDYIEFFIEGTNPRVMLWGIGPFARGKITESLFAHLEYQIKASSNLNDVAQFAFDNNDSFYLDGYRELFKLSQVEGLFKNLAKITTSFFNKLSSL